MNKTKITWQWLSVVLLVITVFAPPAIAGNLNPSALPGPTMKTLDQTPAKDEVIPPWSQTLPASERFKLVLGGEAVLDKETGLVWDRNMLRYSWATWPNAFSICYNSTVGVRRGWRLPTAAELASLMDPAVSGEPKLPSGHPFTGVTETGYLNRTYWSATRDATDTMKVWLVNFGYGNSISNWTFTGVGNYVWCVRGGQGLDAQ